MQGPLWVLQARPAGHPVGRDEGRPHTGQVRGPLSSAGFRLSTPSGSSAGLYSSFPSSQDQGNLTDVGSGYQTEGEAWLAWSAAANAREQRRIARLELAVP